MGSNNTTYVVIAGTDVEVPTIASITHWLAPYEVLITSHQAEQLQKYLGLLVFWNQKISLTSIDDTREIVSRHFGESLFCAKFIPDRPCRLADVGSGAGFPGVPLKILLPYIQVYLIEQDTRKAAFLNEVVRLLNLDTVKVLRTHYETIPSDFANLDTVTARAVGNYKSILKWASPRLAECGQVILMVGIDDATRIMTTKGWIWANPYPVPQSRKRVILIGTLSK
jgi:16S rRNA (guanine527-N7)-methyltransferase